MVESIIVAGGASKAKHGVLGEDNDPDIEINPVAVAKIKMEKEKAVAARKAEKAAQAAKNRAKHAAAAGTAAAAAAGTSSPSKANLAAAPAQGKGRRRSSTSSTSTSTRTSCPQTMEEGGGHDRRPLAHRQGVAKGVRRARRTAYKAERREPRRKRPEEFMIARNHAWEHPDTARVQLYQRVFEREVYCHNTCK